MTRLPNHRLLAVREAQRDKTPLPPDPRMQGLLRWFLNKPDAPPDVVDAYMLYKDHEHRVILDAFFLARAPEELIARIFEIDPAVVSAYGYLFMDMSVFRNRLEIRSYSVHYNNDGDGRDITCLATGVGLEYLIWAYGNQPTLTSEVVSSGVLSPGTTEITRRTMTESFYKGMAHRGNSVVSSVAKEALKWWQQAVHNVAILEKLDPEGKQTGNDAVALALESRDETLGTTQLPVSRDKIEH